jgi:hypothetical protein
MTQPTAKKTTHPPGDSKPASALEQVTRELSAARRECVGDMVGTEAAPEWIEVVRQILEHRGRLMDEIAEWDRPDHPIARYYARVVEVYGGHGLSDLRLASIEQQAKDELRHLRDRLKKLDQAIRIGTREEANDRGLTLNQLRELLEADRSAAETAAEAATLEYLQDRTDYTKRRVQDLLCRYSSTFVKPFPVRIDQLEATARRARAGKSGTLAKLARRMVAIVATDSA